MGVGGGRSKLPVLVLAFLLVHIGRDRAAAATQQEIKESEAQGGGVDAMKKVGDFESHSSSNTNKIRSSINFEAIKNNGGMKNIKENMLITSHGSGGFFQDKGGSGKAGGKHHNLKLFSADYGITIAWSFPLPVSGARSTPVVYDVNGDGQKDVVLASTELAVLDGRTGRYLRGWPFSFESVEETVTGLDAFFEFATAVDEAKEVGGEEEGKNGKGRQGQEEEKEDDDEEGEDVESAEPAGAADDWESGFLDQQDKDFESSPVVFDVDGDGSDDIIAISADAEIFVFHGNGRPLGKEAKKVPWLRVKRNWDEGLAVPGGEGARADGGDRVFVYMSLHGDQSAVKFNQQMEVKRLESENFEKDVLNPFHMFEEFDKFKAATVEKEQQAAGVNTNDWRRRQSQQAESKNLKGPSLIEQFMRAEDEGFVMVDPHVLNTPVLVEQETLASSVRYQKSNLLIVPVDYFFDSPERYFNFQRLVVKARKLLSASGNADKGGSNGSERGGKPIEHEFADLRKYVASAIIVVNLNTWNIEQEFLLDISSQPSSTTSSKEDESVPNHNRSGLLAASPVVVDVDGDQILDIVCATQTGNLYVFDLESGKLKEGYPITLDGDASFKPGPILVEHLPVPATSKGPIPPSMQIVVLDSLDNLNCFDAISAKPVWKKVNIPEANFVRLADMNDDYRIDIVVTTRLGEVIFLDSSTGERLDTTARKNAATGITFNVIRNPTKLEGEVIVAPPFISNIFLYSEVAALVPTAKGLIKILDGQYTGEIDLGDIVVHEILAEDLLGNGRLQLLVLTPDSIICLSTYRSYSRHSAFASNEIGHVGGAAGKFYGRHQGIEIAPEFSHLGYVSGTYFILTFCIKHAGVDGSAIRRGSESALHAQFDREFPSKAIPLLKEGTFVEREEVDQANWRYRIVMKVGNKVALFDKYYLYPGCYTETLKTPTQIAQRTTTVRVQMINNNMQMFFDSFNAEFNSYFYKTIKWIILVPLGIICAVTYQVQKSTFRTNLPM
eukprot:Nk52_evm5s213 gene=Nk52_evmTU5s213